MSHQVIVTSYSIICVTVTNLFIFLFQKLGYVHLNSKTHMQRISLCRKLLRPVGKKVILTLYSGSECFYLYVYRYKPSFLCCVQRRKITKFTIASSCNKQLVRKFEYHLWIVIFECHVRGQILTSASPPHTSAISTQFVITPTVRSPARVSMVSKAMDLPVQVCWFRV